MIPDSIAVGLILLPIGLLSLAFGAWQLWREVSPRGWPQVSGTIVTSRIVTQKTSKGQISVPIIEYEYQWNDGEFRSSRRRASNYISGQRTDAEAVTSRYLVGNSVRVFVSPTDPVKSVLEFGTTPLSWIPLVLGLIFTTVALLPTILK